jgi:hypothetical protein
MSGTNSQHKFSEFSEFVAGTTLTKAADKTVKILGHGSDSDVTAPQGPDTDKFWRGTVVKIL